uniref:Uncharacterized protein n=1 Tax=viral metagenome TaxID=1070528 RepID=A0A6C0B295_9ZZZZ
MSDTSTIDEKKKKTTISDNPSINFAYSLSTSLVSLGVVFIFGSLFLYTGKIAQSNILPTCTSHEPYTYAKQTIGKQQIDINILKTEKGIFSTKLLMPIDQNMKIVNKTLGFLRKMIYGKDTNVFKLYFATIIQQVLAFNFSINNTVFNFMNESLTETMNILLSPMIMIFVQSIVGFIVAIYFIIMWFYNIYLLFSTKEEDSKGLTMWKDGEMWGVLTWYWSIFYIIALSILLFIFIATGLLSILTFVITLFCLFFPLSLHLYNNSNAEQYTLSDTIKYVFKFKMNIIMYLISFIVIMTTNSNFGGYAAFVSLIACVLLFLFSRIFKSSTPNKITTPGIGTFFQAGKNCDPIIKASQESSMFQKIGDILKL